MSGLSIMANKNHFCFPSLVSSSTLGLGNVISVQTPYFKYLADGTRQENDPLEHERKAFASIAGGAPKNSAPLGVEPAAGDEIATGGCLLGVVGSTDPPSPKSFEPN